MRRITFTLLTDGSSDRCLLPHIQWAIAEALAGESYQLDAQWADLRGLPQASTELADRIRLAVELYPCDLLLIHRDSESQPYAKRETEITAALGELSASALPVSARLVPVRMQETWLLVDEQAIRVAAGNPKGRVALAIPRIGTLETLPNPKVILHTALRAASELSARRLHRFNPEARAFQVGDSITDFTPLRQLPSFQRFSVELRQALAAVKR
ncbi:hypothetical protein A0257_11185 [Hymenobacter psoromatis]|nr:hypothetical protein A0257_11185 [Hymenobacter psoromatis]